MASSTGSLSFLDAAAHVHRPDCASLAEKPPEADRLPEGASDEVIAYGKQLSAAVGGKHFVIDTSRNGNGAPKVDGDSEAAWCNPDGRALGSPPTTETSEPLCDAFLWIKKPGESDGTCNGGPKAGEWWQEKALELVKNSKQ